MQRYKITAPVAATCTVAGIAFVDGVGETCSEVALSYFRRHGYTIQEVADPPEAPPVEQVPPPERNASTTDWRSWAVEHAGVDTELAALLSRDLLATRYLGPVAKPATPKSTKEAKQAAPQSGEEIKEEMKA